MASSVRSATTIGLDAQFIEVETDLHFGLPTFLIVGLADTAVQEARERVRSSIKHCGAIMPGHRIIVNLAPADVKKEGPSLDVPIAVSILCASEQLPVPPRDMVFLGELALDGTVRRVRGVLPIVAACARHGVRTLYVPYANAQEASFVQGVCVLPVRSLSDIMLSLRHVKRLRPTPYRKPDFSYAASDHTFRDIVGQQQAKRALEIAAAGGHNVLLSGPPGAGKTMLAKALISLLPPLTFAEALDVAKVYSVAGLLSEEDGFVRHRPFRHPHHSASAASIVGGGRVPRPGEISLAHRGVLFLDEFPEFPRPALEALREPLEEGVVVVSRVAGSVRYPADFILIAAMNPCPCGFATDPDRRCTCSPQRVALYQKHISGPLLDRIDLHVAVPRLPFAAVTQQQPAADLPLLQQRIARARQVQTERNDDTGLLLNSRLSPRQLHRVVHVDAESNRLLESAVDGFHLSLRIYHRILKVSRTIADLEGSHAVKAQHVAEALQYRPRIE